MRGDEEREGGPRATGHVPVMLDRILALLGPALSTPSDEDVFFVDATLGLGGHAAAVLEAHPRVTLIGLDRDTSAIERSGRRLEAYAGRTRLVHAVYDEIPRVLAELGIPDVHAVLFDLGVSSPQLDEAERGFAYSYDAPLDMRMDRTQELTAEQVVNTYSASDLTRILRDYGEERFARRVAEAIVRERGRAPLTSTGRLVEIVRDAIPAASRRTGGHPGKRTFQALRMEVNGELPTLERAIPAALDALVVGGRVAVLSYHSLEDRIVKRAFAAQTTDTTPPDLPVPLPELQPRFRPLTRGAEQPSEEETTTNPRAASARLRAVERIREREGRPRGGTRPLDEDPPSGRRQAGGTT
ncbi:16S rRNA (cytosine(1402)-N(4))-methyltransferase RsmH [Actinoallomurus iriomotensis]|uniref:Ribosomal RNA small subunit methyltransferase H n=1 Tax=Actinoallomurus iriomotensis TaxID=478107 RepID=A0A9W6VWC8_9ACTN|nr:16S rRNA (cytosine(1402)-N(4))-methyltransferase RsmH [Actinoallomurus iriomotensis]GLY82715.1 ribosomal RNA small subunit methyltransferase H [Actinoallomurus iriomotensis]